ncbi:MAG TPA: translesion error-prone DNA polymerase V autoproteolytic subunit [Methylophilaceae bacterium]|jgi:DNA polymerase V
MTISNRGGKRANAGRKSGSNAYGEPTVAMRVPQSKQPVVRDFLKALQRKRAATSLGNVSEWMEMDAANSDMALPLYTSKVAAGFPSAADDHVEQRLSPNEYLVQNDNTTFFVCVKGDSMIDAGIFEDDMLVVDRERVAQIGDIILAMVDGEFTVKILGHSETSVRLIPANKHYPVIEIGEEQLFEVWGVITGSMRKFV